MLAKLASLRWFLGIFMSSALVLGIAVPAILSDGGGGGGGSAETTAASTSAPTTDELGPGGSAPGDSGYPGPAEPTPNEYPYAPNELLPPQPCGGVPAPAVDAIERGLVSATTLERVGSVSVEDTEGNRFLFVSGSVDGQPATWMVDEGGEALIFAADSGAEGLSAFEPAPVVPGHERAVESARQCAYGQ